MDPNSRDGDCASADESPLTLLWGTWEMWCDIAQQRQSGYGAEQTNWLEQVKSIGLFDSAEGFWGIFNCVVLPSQLPPNSSYHLFRKHIAPMWEHEANRRGGKWVIPFAGRLARDAEDLQPVDVAWQTLCLSAIGELFPGDEEEICGVTVSRGKQRTSPSGHSAPVVGEWKLCLWTRSAEDGAVQARIAEYIRRELRSRAPSTERVGPAQGSGRGTARSPDCLPASKAREPTGLPPNITYVAHRALMEAKQDFVKGGGGTAQTFKPKYTHTMDVCANDAA
ncbi:eukaryotic translation initiation factor-like protein [Novymonas esmeraldas]|uniref:Eukaryotic translation initiation factor-like protein n=1 Tax=Novymonas esmeraldas TaxID=1808958 RepID=A0AAW0EUW8_9TRYP